MGTYSGQVAIHTSGRDTCLQTQNNNTVLLTLPPPLDQLLSSLSNMLSIEFRTPVSTPVSRKLQWNSELSNVCYTVQRTMLVQFMQWPFLLCQCKLLHAYI